MTERYNKGVRQVTFKTGDLVMLHQEKRGKLDPSWRGPFVIAGYGLHGVSYTIKQINGRKIAGTFHGDHLILFMPRGGHLASDRDPQFPTKQTIRKPVRAKKKKLTVPSIPPVV